MNDQKELKDVNALRGVIELLNHLDDNERKWVIESVIRKFEISDAMTSQNKKEDIASTHSKADTDSIVNPDLAQFLQNSGKISQGQKVALIAYWLTKNKSSKQVSMGEIRDEYKRLGDTEPDRLDMTIRNAVFGRKKLFNKIDTNTYELTYRGNLFATSGKETLKNMRKRRKK